MDRGHEVVILGGGFGGLAAAQALRTIPVNVTLVDRRNFHLFQPLLYQVATGTLSPANIASPLRELLKRQRNTRVLLGEAVAIDAAARRIRLADGALPYDTLIVATGASHNYFGRDAWSRWAPSLKTIEDATEIRSRILRAFEAAEREEASGRAAAWLTFVVIGAGPTGVELAGAMAEIARDTLAHNFRRIDPSRARIVLLEGAERVLPAYPARLSERAEAALTRLGVVCRTGATVTDILADRVVARIGGRDEVIEARTAVWAAGVTASALGQSLADSTGCRLDQAGRVIVEPDLTVPGHPEMFVIGDLAHARVQHGRPLPGLAPVALQEGRYVAQSVARRLRGRAVPPFRYRDYGVMATIGRGRAVADVMGWLQLAGPVAWLAWLFIHLLGIVTFQNRLLVLIQWAWSYVTYNRGARLITGEANKKTEAARPFNERH